MCNREKFGDADIYDVEVPNSAGTRTLHTVPVTQLYLAWSLFVTGPPRIIRVKMRCPESCLQWMSQSGGDPNIIDRWFDGIMRGYASQLIRTWEDKWATAVPIPYADENVNWERNTG